MKNERSSGRRGAAGSRRVLILGGMTQGAGVSVEGARGVTDALLATCGAGDIGTHFPPSDPQWKGAASHIFLQHAIEMTREMGFALMNCDVTLICERPKIGPHAVAMREALAAIMGLEADRVSVKATTTEQLGFLGRAEGLAAQAAVLLHGAP